jgi:hypothetical protein
MASSMGPIERLSLYSDYKQFGMALMATKVTQEVRGTISVFTLESVTFDDVKPEELAPPPEVRALIGG